MLVLMLQAFPCADGLCHLPGVGGLRMKVSHLPRVCRHHAGPPPPPPPRGGRSLVMSGDDDPGHEPYADVLNNLANLPKNQPVTGQTFAQKQGPFILGLFFLLGQLVLYFGLLFAGRGKRLPVILKFWGVQDTNAPVKVTFELYQVLLACAFAGTVIGVASCPIWLGR